MILVDTTILLRFYLDPDCTALLQEVLQRDSHWVAPSTWRSGMCNVLGRYLQQGELELEAALDLLNGAERLLSNSEVEPASSDVLCLAQSSGCSAYGCELIALACELETVLITFDPSLLTYFPSIALTPTAFLASEG